MSRVKPPKQCCYEFVDAYGSGLPDRAAVLLWRSVSVSSSRPKNGSWSSDAWASPDFCGFRRPRPHKYMMTPMSAIAMITARDMKAIMMPG